MAFQVGDIINSRYRLVSERGRGTFGEVWQAWDEILDMEVAIKIYIALDARGIQEFKSEFRTTFALSHPNLLHASHFDVIEKRPYLVMPYCPESADQLVGKISEVEAWQFIKDVSSGLTYLHSKDIIHRDIKPDNILRDSNGDFLITDFGVSVKMRSTLRKNSVRELSESATQGTIGYMGPEMFASDASAVKATDIWALGASVYEMLEGELPFFGQGGGMQMYGAELPNLKGPWSAALKNVVHSCLEKDTWVRPKAEQLADYAKSMLNGSDIVPVLSVKLSDHSLIVTEGESAKLEASVFPDNASEKAVIWKSSDPSVASVSQSGVVEAKSSGNAEITVTSKNNNQTDSCQVTVKVKVIPVESVSVSKDSLALTEGDSFKLDVKIGPKDATNKEVNWSSSDPDIVSVDSEGNILAKAKGKAKIIVQSAGGEDRAKCSVEVKAKPKPKPAPEPVPAGITSTDGLTAPPEKKRGMAWLWILLLAVAIGVGVWFASQKGDGSKPGATATEPVQNEEPIQNEDPLKVPTVVIKDQPTQVEENPVRVSGVTLNKTELSLEEGKGGQLTATVHSDGADNKSVTWKSGNPSVATVSQKGYVSAKKAGTTTITVTTTDGGKTAVCSVTVKEKAPQLEPAKSDSQDLSTVSDAVVKQKADAGDTDACAEYARRRLEADDYDNADKYARKAGRAKATSVVVRLRKIGYYDEGAEDPGWK